MDSQFNYVTRLDIKFDHLEKMDINKMVQECTDKWFNQTLTQVNDRDIDRHQEWMIRSYALCFGAVTFRIMGPLLQFGFDMEFIPAYKIISWAAWILNLSVAEVIIRNKRRAAVVA